MILWYEKLNRDYQNNINQFLEYVTSLDIDKIYGHEEALYAIAHLCVDNSDYNAIHILSQEGYCKCIQNIENFLFDNEKERNAFLLRYNIGELTIWGKSISLQDEAIVSELELYFQGGTCSLIKWLTEWDLIFSIEGVSDEFIEFCSNSLDLWGEDVLFFMLLFNGKENIAEKLLRAKDTVDRKTVLEEIRSNIKEEDMFWYSSWTSRDITIQQAYIILNRLIEMISKINAIHTWDCLGVIESIETQYDDTKLIIKTTSSCYEAEIDMDQNCCEIFGGYIICEEDIRNYEGSTLLKITLTDVALKNYVVKEINSIQNSHHSCDYHNIQFINFETSKGVLQFVVYNCHNGYYGHDITIRQDDTIIYQDNI